MTAWLRRPGPTPASAARLVCLPHAGGTAAFYRPLVERLRPAIATTVIQYPGRHERFTEPAYTDIDRLADEIAGLLPWEVAAPFALFGHSMGALVAYEVAVRLAAVGVEVGSLIVSAAAEPAVRRPTRAGRRSDADLVAELRAMGGTDDTLLDDATILAMILPALRSDLTALDAYRPRKHPPLRLPITALVGDADPFAPVADVDAWRGYTTGPFDLEVLTGGHFYFSGNEDRLDEILADCILPARAPNPHR